MKTKIDKLREKLAQAQTAFSIARAKVDKATDAILKELEKGEKEQKESVVSTKAFRKAQAEARGEEKFKVKSDWYMTKEQREADKAWWEEQEKITAKFHTKNLE